MKVIDASALLALLNAEPGATTVAAILEADARVSTVNLAEVVGKLNDYGMSDDDIGETLDNLGLVVEAFTEEQALETGVLRKITREAGLSLGDRACLALATLTESVAVTADHRWENLTSVELEFIR